MKICAACSQTLPKEKFSKKQWQLKQSRRCKECIADNREVKQLEASNDVTPKGAPLCVSDEDLFKQPPPRDECPICFLILPLDRSMIRYKSCCGKMICSGCTHAADEADSRRLCPFCRAPPYTSDSEHIERLKKRMEAGDAAAMRNLGCYYRDGRYGLRQNLRKANKLFLRAGKLGCSMAYGNIGYAFVMG